MQQVLLSIPEQIEVALDGRTRRWLAIEIRMPETELSKKMNGKTDFTDQELETISSRLKAKIKRLA